MKCANCGKDCKDTAKFCQGCGKVLSRTDSKAGALDEIIAQITRDLEMDGNGSASTKSVKPAGGSNVKPPTTASSATPAKPAIKPNRPTNPSNLNNTNEPITINTDPEKHKNSAGIIAVVIVLFLMIVFFVISFNNSNSASPKPIATKPAATRTKTPKPLATRRPSSSATPANKNRDVILSVEEKFGMKCKPFKQINANDIYKNICVFGSLALDSLPGSSRMTLKDGSTTLDVLSNVYRYKEYLKAGTCVILMGRSQESKPPHHFVLADMGGKGVFYFGSNGSCSK